MKPFIVLFGNTYYPSGWADYAGEADTLEEAEAIVVQRTLDEGERDSSFFWSEIIDLRTKQLVTRR